MNDIYCDFVRVSENSDLFACRYCKQTTKDISKTTNICPILIENSNNPSIKLIKTTVISQETGEDVTDWWYTSVVPSVPRTVDQPQQSSVKKQCSQEQIERRMNICQQCPFFENNTCLKCGCSLSREKVYMNKLNWADQSCPIGKWGPES